MENIAQYRANCTTRSTLLSSAESLTKPLAIGGSITMFLFSSQLIFLLHFLPDPLPDLQPLGCYKDHGRDRALPRNYANFRGQMNWTQLETVQQCAQVAFNKGYEYFAVQFYGVCYTGNDASQTYDKHGGSGKCFEADKTLGFRVGEEYTNFVYRINIDATHDQIRASFHTLP